MPTIDDRISEPSTTVHLDELRKSIEWLLEEISQRVGGSLSLPYDFYQRPVNLSDLFCSTEGVKFDSYGSLLDEIDFMRNGILSGHHDLPQIVAERLGYLFLALAATLRKLD